MRRAAVPRSWRTRCITTCRARSVTCSLRQRLRSVWVATVSSAWLVDPLSSLILCTDAIAKLETERKPRPNEDRAAAPYAQGAKHHHGMSSPPTQVVPNTYHSPDFSAFCHTSPAPLPLTHLLFRASSSNLPSSAPTASSSRPSRPKSRPSTTAALLFPGAASETSPTTSKRDSSHARREVRGQRINFGTGARERQSLMCEVRWKGK